MKDAQLIDRFALQSAGQTNTHLALVRRGDQTVWVCETQHGDFDIPHHDVIALVYLHMCCKPLPEVVKDAEGTTRRAPE